MTDLDPRDGAHAPEGHSSAPVAHGARRAVSRQLSRCFDDSFMKLRGAGLIVAIAAAHPACVLNAEVGLGGRDHGVGLSP